MSGSEQPVSAQVVMRSASGLRVDGDVPITSENVADYQPAAEEVASAAERFRRSGFEVGPMVGISFSITAPAQTFETFFGVRLGRTPEGGFAVLPDGGGAALELPLDRLPRALAGLLVTVTFSPPAELFGDGETSFF